MLLPIYLYGQPVLRKIAANIDKDFPNFEELLANMWETMTKADGVGLAAPQIGQSIRLFVIDGSGFADKDPSMKEFRKSFINAQMLDESGEDNTFNEGCLSVPSIREDVVRKSKIKIRYQDENFNEYEEEFDGLKARIIQHEYDHLQGKLLIDHINPLKRRMLQGKLNNISKGKVTCDYKFKILK